MGISGQERMVDREKQRRAGIHSQTSFFFRFVLRIFVEGTVDRVKHERAGIISQTYALKCPCIVVFGPTVTEMIFVKARCLTIVL
jgi:hypothetical protein